MLTQASLIFFHSFICIFEVDSNILSLVGRKYSSELDIFSLVYSYICVRNIGFCTQEYTPNLFKARIAILDGGIV